MKVLLVALLAVLVYNSPNVRSQLANGLDSLSDTIRPQSELQRKIDNLF